MCYVCLWGSCLHRYHICYHIIRNSYYACLICDVCRMHMRSISPQFLNCILCTPIWELRVCRDQRPWLRIMITCLWLCLHLRFSYVIHVITCITMWSYTCNIHLRNSLHDIGMSDGVLCGVFNNGVFIFSWGRHSVIIRFTKLFEYIMGITMTYLMVVCMIFSTHEDKSVRVSWACKEGRITFNPRDWVNP